MSSIGSSTPAGSVLHPARQAAPASKALAARPAPPSTSLSRTSPSPSVTSRSSPTATQPHAAATHVATSLSPNLRNKASGNITKANPPAVKTANVAVQAADAKGKADQKVRVDLKV